MAQARQIIGRKPNGTPIYGPPTSAPPVNASFERLLQPQAEVTVGAPMDVLSLQPSVPDAPQRGVVDTVRDGVSALKDWVSQDGIFGVARKVAQAVLPEMIDEDLYRAGRLVKAAKNFSVGNSVRAVGARAVPWMRDVAQGASEITGEQLGSALNTFVKNVAGADYELVKPDGQPLSQHQGLEWAALGAAALMPIGPGGKANLAKKGINAGVDAARAVARGADEVDALMQSWHLRPPTPRTPGTISVRPGERVTLSPTPGVRRGVRDVDVNAAEASLSRRLVQQTRARDTARPKETATLLPPTETSPHPLLVGDIQPEDWVQHRMSLLNPQELTEARQWYARLHSLFVKYLGPDDAEELLPPWAMSQQQASPAAGMENVLRLEQQVIRGVDPIWWRKARPETREAFTALSEATKASQYSRLYKALDDRDSLFFPTTLKKFKEQTADGMDYSPRLSLLEPGLAAEKIRNQFMGEFRGQGIGKKLSDFFDNTFQKRVRTYMGNDPRGGHPTAIDVWAGKDRGFIDNDVLKRIEKVYGKDVASRLQRDFTSGIDDNRYEDGVMFYQELTDHLNANKIDGGNWTPEEAQAVGWVAYQRAFGIEAGTPESIFTDNTRTVAMELAFGKNSPYAKQFPALSSLPYPQASAITEDVAKKVVDLIADDTGVRITSLRFGPRGWEANAVNPSGQIDTLAPPERVQDFIDSVGYLLQQDMVIASRASKSGDAKGLRLTFTEPIAQIDTVAPNFWSALQKRMPSAFNTKGSGFSPGEDNGKIALKLFQPENKKAWSDALAMQKAIDGAASDAGIASPTVGEFSATLLTSSNDWSTQNAGQAFLLSLDSRGRSDLSGRLVSDYQPEVKTWIRDAFSRHTAQPAGNAVGAGTGAGAVSRQPVGAGPQQKQITRPSRTRTPLVFPPSGGVR